MKTFRGSLPKRASIALVLLGLTGAGCNHIGNMHFYSISSASMQPTLYEGDKVAVDESYYKTHSLRDGDVVVFRHKDYVIAKRVSALPGESIEGKNGMLIRNGLVLSETYIAPSSGQGPEELATFPLRNVGPDEIFVVGDNREASLDSRVPEFGSVRVSDVMGKVVSVYQSSHGTAGRAL